MSTTTNTEHVAHLAAHVLLVLRDFPTGNVSRQEADGLAVAILEYIGAPIPEWRVAP